MDGGGTVREEGSRVAWWVAGGLLAVVFLALGYPVLTRTSPSPAGEAGAPGGGPEEPEGSGLVDLSAMSVEDQATVLFNRVMRSSSVGDTADVDFFLPKALFIHEELNPTDPDGLYHFALLHQVGGDHEAALAKAREGLAQVPDYLLLLAVAGESSVALGQEEAAREYFRHFLEVYEAEMARMRPGYEHHQPVFPVYRDEAEAFLSRD